jgi:hypothetical protein
VGWDGGIGSLYRQAGKTSRGTGNFSPLWYTGKGKGGRSSGSGGGYRGENRNVVTLLDIPHGAV